MTVGVMVLTLLLSRLPTTVGQLIYGEEDYADAVENDVPDYDKSQYGVGGGGYEYEGGEDLNAVGGGGFGGRGFGGGFNDYEASTPAISDACESSPCGSGATCEGQETGFNCTCAEGQTGETCEVMTPQSVTSIPNSEDFRPVKETILPELQTTPAENDTAPLSKQSGKSRASKGIAVVAVASLSILAATLTCGYVIKDELKVCAVCFPKRRVRRRKVVRRAGARGRQTAVQPNQTVVQPNQTVLQNNQTAVQPNQSVLQPSQLVVQPNQTILQSNQTVVQPSPSTMQPNQPQQNIAIPQYITGSAGQNVLLQGGPGQTVSGALNFQVKSPVALQGGQPMVPPPLGNFQGNVAAIPPSKSPMKVVILNPQTGEKTIRFVDDISALLNQNIQQLGQDTRNVPSAGPGPNQQVQLINSNIQNAPPATVIGASTTQPNDGTTVEEQKPRTNFDIPTISITAPTVHDIKPIRDIKSDARTDEDVAAIRKKPGVMIKTITE